MVKIHIIRSGKADHRFNIKMIIDQIEGSTIKLMLPKWRPGRYELTNNEANIFDLQVVDTAYRPVNVIKSKTSEYIVDTEAIDQLTISYSYYANQPDAGGSYCSENELYINFINCIFTIAGYEKHTHRVSFFTPENWVCSTSLRKKNASSYEANDIDDLYDAPIVISKQMESFKIPYRGCDFFIDLIGNHQVNTDRLVLDFKKFITFMVNLFGKAYTDEFRFIIKINPYKCYHGVEHFKSTMITLGPSEESDSEAFYENLLGICSHELFHHWNAKLLRPKELVGYDYFEPVLFNTGYVIEGFTTFFGDYVLYKSGVCSHKWFIGEINKSLKRHCLNFGRMHQNLLESSIDLWVDGYKNLAPNRKVSIYTEGSLFAFILNEWLQKNTHSGLSDLLKQLIGQCTKSGYTHDDVIRICSDTIPKEVTNLFFVQYLIRKNGIIDGLLATLEDSPTYKIKLLSPEENYERLFGFKLTTKDESRFVSAIDPSSEAVDSLYINDKVCDVNIMNDIAEITLERNDFEQVIKLTSTGKSYLSYYEIEIK